MRRRGLTLRRRYGRAARRDVMVLTHRGAWRYERVRAQVGMPVRINMGVDRAGQVRSGSDDFVITRVDPKHNRVAIKPTSFGGYEHWHDAANGLVMGGPR